MVLLCSTQSPTLPLYLSPSVVHWKQISPLSYLSGTLGASILFSYRGRCTKAFFVEGIISSYSSPLPTVPY
jgi:hypothetical protein